MTKTCDKGHKYDTKKGCKACSKARCRARQKANDALGLAKPPEGWTATVVKSNGEGDVTSVRSVPETENDEMQPVIPAEHYVRGVSTFLTHGTPTHQWVKTDTEKMSADAGRWAAIEALIAGGVPAAPVIAYERVPTMAAEKLCNVIVFGDPHVGMLAQARETGAANWDLKIAKRVMNDALDLMLVRLPRAQSCILINIGDFFHFQDNSKLTPRGKHQLDGDCRLMHMAELGCHLMADLTSKALCVYESVEEFNVPGNHDPDAARWMNIFMRAWFRDNPRVRVADNAAEHLYTSFGENLIGMHHGHYTPLPKLQNVLAEWRDGVPWGSHKHRRWVTGHHHTYEAYSYPGVIAEKYPTLAPLDFHAAGSGYRSERSLNAFTLHAEVGEIGRAKVFAAEVE